MYKYDKDYISSNITQKHIGTNLILLDEVDSTNKYALNLTENPDIGGTVIVADVQRAGKGRLERSWYSPKGVNLYMSLILKPGIESEEINILTFISSVATVNTLADYGIDSEIKWPNDVLIDKKKVSGVLTEINMHKNKLEYVVVGIGVNLNVDAASLKMSGLEDIATSVCIEQNEQVNRNEFLIKLLNNLDNCYESFLTFGKQHIYNEWTYRWKGKGKTVSVSTENEQFEGKCVGLDENGFMIVKKYSGETIKIITGDVSLL